MPALKKTLFSTLIATTTAIGACLTAPVVTATMPTQDSLRVSPGNSGHYAIQIASIVSPKAARNILKEHSSPDYMTYVKPTSVEDLAIQLYANDGVLRHSIRVGFFNSKSKANKVAQSLRKHYPDLRITKVEKSEKMTVMLGDTLYASVAQQNTVSPAPLLLSAPLLSARDTLLPMQKITADNSTSSAPMPLLLAAEELTTQDSNQDATQSTSEQTQPPEIDDTMKEEIEAVEQQAEETTSPSPVVDETLKPLMERAKQSMIAQEYDRAIQLYTKVLREPENPYTRQALEFTGVARERKGQKARAKNTYDEYLKRYPEGDDAVRVQQRLTALITATDVPKPSTTEIAKKDEPSRWDFYGGISQFYRRDESTTELEDFEITSVNREALSTDVYLTGRYRGEEYDLRTRFSGGYEEDFLDSDESELRISTLYVDVQDRQATNSLRLGRQSSSTGGVLGRFDGAILGHSFNETVKLNLVTGFPVETSTFDEINTDRYFYGLNVDLGTFADAWDYNLFIIELQNDGILDRRAVGGEVRFFIPDRTLFSLVDYDISYDELNTVFVLGSWTNARRQTFNVSLDYRNSPTLTTTNAIQSQGVNTLSELLATGITEDQARQLALDRTIRNSTATIGMIQPVSENFQLTGDLTITKLDGTPASPQLSPGSMAVEAFEGTDNEYSIFIQAIGNDLIKTGDLAVVGLRFTDATTSKRYALNINTRYPFTESLRINPRLQTEYRENTDDDTDQWFVRPSIRGEYRWLRKTRFELELGGEYSNRDLTDDTSETTSYFISLGYRHDF